MLYLENIEELDILKYDGIIQICQKNRDIFIGYGKYTRNTLYETFKEKLNNNFKIIVPELDEKYYKSIKVKNYY